MEITENTQQIEELEDAYTAFNSTDIPNWGSDEEQTKGRMADELQRLYDEAGTDEYDRIVL